jgi:L-asparaginase
VAEIRPDPIEKENEMAADYEENLYILNTGGTFNKIYDPIMGRLVVPRNDDAVQRAVEATMSGKKITIEGIVYKDSLDMEERDREEIADTILARDEKVAIVVHGTDTMNETASCIARRLGERDIRVILTGAMVPFSIEPLEAVANLSVALSCGYRLERGVYISMHSLLLPHDSIRKNRETGRFEAVKS